MWPLGNQRGGEANAILHGRSWAGLPRLHLHAAFGRDDRVTAGCIRLGVTTWIVGEVIVFELTDSRAERRPDVATGFELLEP